MATKDATPAYDDEYYRELFSLIEQYNDYHIPAVEVEHDFIHPTLEITRKVMLSLTVVFGCFALVIFLTVISAKARSASASWYMYCLALETVILSLVFTPIVDSRSIETQIYEICRIEDTRKSLGLLRAINIVLINLEVVFTILFPWQPWIKTTLTRFLVALCTMWTVTFVFADMILPSLQDSHCFDFKHSILVGLHILLNLLPGLIVLCLTITGIVFYSKGYFLRQAQTTLAAQHLQIRNRAHEWFIFLIIMNAQFLLLDLVLIEFINNIYTHGFLTIVYLTVLHELLRLLLPLTLLAISDVRSALREALKRPWSLTVYCQKDKTFDEEALTLAPTADQFV